MMWFLHHNLRLRYTSAVHESNFLVYNKNIMWLAGWMHPRFVGSRGISWQL